MADLPSLALVGGGLVGVALVVLALVIASRRWRTPAVARSPGYRLAVLMRQRPDYVVLVGVPPDRATRWARVSGLGEASLAVEGHPDIPLTEVQAFAVAYANGQLVDCELGDLSDPPGLGGLPDAWGRDDDVLQEADLEVGKGYVRVSYGPSELRPGLPGHYSTTLTNVANQRVRVLRFAGYMRIPKGWLLNTITGTFFSAEEFREWYGMGRRKWIGPGESVRDPNNYGGPPTLWAYYCQAEDGTTFVAGGQVT